MSTMTLPAQSVAAPEPKQRRRRGPRTNPLVYFVALVVVALTLGGYDTADIGVFNDMLAQDEALGRLRGKISVVGDLDGIFGARTTIRLGDDTMLEAAWDVSEADIGPNDLDDRLDRKFSVLATPLIGAARVREVLDLSYDIRKTDLAKLSASLHIA